jgi:hypothetical protein
VILASEVNQLYVIENLINIIVVLLAPSVTVLQSIVNIICSTELTVIDIRINSLVYFDENR